MASLDDDEKPYVSYRKRAIAKLAAQEKAKKSKSKLGHYIPLKQRKLIDDLKATQVIYQFDKKKGGEDTDETTDDEEKEADKSEEHIYMGYGADGKLVEKEKVKENLEDGEIRTDENGNALPVKETKGTGALIADLEKEVDKAKNKSKLEKYNITCDADDPTAAHSSSSDSSDDSNSDGEFEEKTKHLDFRQRSEMRRKRNEDKARKRLLKAKEKEEKKRRAKELARQKKEDDKRKIADAIAAAAGADREMSLFDQNLIDQGIIAEETKNINIAQKERMRERQAIAEDALMNTVPDARALVTAKQVAGKELPFEELIKTNWKAPKWLRNKPMSYFDRIRRRMKIDVEGDRMPPVCKTFEQMKLPAPLLAHLKTLGIKKPTPIQMQGIPVLLSGRDMIGISYTGSGKTMVFCLPMILLAMEQECMMPFRASEGPFGLIVVPSRELAKQTYDVIKEIIRIFDQAGSPYPNLNVVLCIGFWGG